jgi:predicted nucleic acid-binding protein
MIFIDSWVWLEFIFRGKKFSKVKKLLEEIKAGEKSIINTMVLAEIKYNIEKKFGKKYEEVIPLIEKFPNLQIVPVDIETAKLAANLRAKYYKKPERMVSYADMINVATALLNDCKKFYTGDKNLKDIEEIEVVVI